MKTNYAKIAVDAAKLAQKEQISPADAWEKIRKETKLQNKECPKHTFLGLCQEGHIKNIKKGDYTKSKKNLNYAVIGIGLIKTNHEIYDKNANSKVLWKDILNKCNKQISPNQQADVILALWKEDLLNLT